MTLPIPTIHSNGTDARSLVDQAKEVYTSLQEAMDLMAKARPHGRDYYPQGDKALIVAADAHAELFLTVQKVQREFAEYAIAIQKLGSK